MFLTCLDWYSHHKQTSRIRRNPLKSGQCFLQNQKNGRREFFPWVACRNPLKSGQCFLRVRRKKEQDLILCRRNPLKSGQCFLHEKLPLIIEDFLKFSRNPLKSGQCFLHGQKSKRKVI